ncbi:MAG: hypothetical protein AB7O80_16395 [Acetobacteraceae bacterium]
MTPRCPFERRAFAASDGIPQGSEIKWLRRATSLLRDSRLGFGLIGGR